MGARARSFAFVGVVALLVCASRLAGAQPMFACPDGRVIPGTSSALCCGPGQIASAEFGGCIMAAACPPGYSAIDSVRCIETVAPAAAPVLAVPAPQYASQPQYPYAAPLPQSEFQYAPTQPAYAYAAGHRNVLPPPQYAYPGQQPLVIHLIVLPPVAVYASPPFGPAAAPQPLAGSYDATGYAARRLRGGNTRRRAGLAVWLAGYGLSALTGLVSPVVSPSSSVAAAWFFVPVIGPAVGGLMMDSRPGSTPYPMLMVGLFETAVQVTGMVIALASSRSHDDEQPEQYRSRRRRPRRGEWLLAPAAAAGYAGLNFTARTY